MYSVSSFRYMLANSFCAILSFRALVLVGLFILHLEAVFMSAHFSLTANVSHGTLDLVLCLVGMYSAAVSKWVLTKFSYSSFGVCVSLFSCSASYLVLSVNAYSFLISLLLNRAKSLCMVVVVWVTFFHRLNRIFAITIWWLEDTPSNEE